MSLVDLGKRLLESAKLGNTDDVRTLMSNGAPFTTDWLGTSPLHFAAQNGHLSTVETLLRAGISRDARTKVDRTPLHVAAQEGHMHICNLLLDHQADIDAKDMLKMTPLHWAAEKSHPDVIHLLLKYGADVNLMDKFDRTPVDIPFSNGREDIAEILQLAPGVKSIEALNMDLGADYTHETVITETEISDTDLIEATVQLDKDASSHLVSTDIAESPTTVPSTEVNSTSVLSTLAALAEATSTPTKRVKGNEALSWLENHGITMVSTSDGGIVSSAVQSGQSVALTEAGKLAINLIKNESLKKSGEENLSDKKLSECHVIVQDVAADGEDGSREVEIVVDIEEVGDTELLVPEVEAPSDVITATEDLIVVGDQDATIPHTEDPPAKRQRMSPKKEGKKETPTSPSQRPVRRDRMPTGGYRKLLNP